MLKSATIAALAVVTIAGLTPSSAAAQPRGREQNRGPVVHRAVPRDRVPRSVRPQIVRVVPYRYRTPYGARLYYGYPRSYYGYPRAYRGYSYGYGYGYGYGPYRYSPAAFVAPIPGRLYGGVRIDLDERHAEVFVDGYFVGTVDDFDGVFQQVNLEPGPHRIEIRAPGYESIQFEVKVLPGQTITYRAPMRPLP